MPLQRTYYEILGVPPTATPEEIKKKYRELARKYHPDLVADKALGQKVFAQINMAYRMVGDADRRRQYDATLTPGGTGPGAASRPGANVGPGSSRGSGVMPSSGTSAGAAAAARPGQVSGVATATAAAPNPEEIDRLLAEADTALLRADADRALAVCQSILKRDARNARAYGTMGDAHMQLRQYPQAETAYRKSLEIAPSSLIRNKLGQLRMLMNTVGAATPDDAPPEEKPQSRPKPAAPEKRGIFPWQRKSKK